MSRDQFSFFGDDEQPTRNGGISSSSIDLEMVLHYDTGKAVQVSDTGEEKRAVWLAHKHILINRNGREVPAVKRDGQHTILPVVTITIPEWLAKKEGLI